jgi:protein involved in polysaccharide export with SLBB domain
VLQSRNPRYRLGRGDTVELNFSFVPAFNQTVTIQPDGFITLRPLGDLHVVGKTVPELTQLLQVEYGKILQNPAFTVELKDFEKPYFIASGQVTRPGKYELRGDTTVAQAVAVAGGFNEKAKHSQVLLFRRVSDEWVEVKQLDMKKMFQEANLSEDLHLQPGDMLFVPQNFLSKVKSFIPAARMSLSPSDF